MSAGNLDRPIIQPESGTNSRTRAWSLTSLLIVLYIVNYADKAVLGIIAQPLAEELGLNSSQIGMVGSLFFLTFTIGGFTSGLLDRWMGLRWSLFALAAAWSIVMLPLLVSASFTGLVICRMLLGLAEGPSSALLHTAAYSWHPANKRGLPGAMLASSASVAKIALAPALAYVTVTMGWRAAIICLSAIGVLWCLAWLPRWSDGPFADKSSKSESSGSAEANVPWTRIFRTRTFMFGALLMMSFYALQTVILTWLPSYFELGLGYSRQQAGSMFALPSVAALIFMLTASAVSDRLLARGASVRNARVVIPAIGVLICSAALLSLPHLDSPLLAVITFSVGYGCACPVFPLLTATIGGMCPPRQLAGTLGAFLALMSIGGLVAPWATGIIVDRALTKVDGFTTSFQILGIITAVSGVLVLLLVRPDRDQITVRGMRR